MTVSTYGELKKACEDCGAELTYVETILQEQYASDDGETTIDDFPSGSPQCFVCRDYHFESGFDFAGDFNSDEHTLSIVQHPKNESWFIAICRECRDQHKIFTKSLHNSIQDYAKR